MTQDEAKAIIASYHSKYMKRSSPALAPEQLETLHQASKRLEEKIKEVDTGNGVFVRLSTRRYG
jgi:5-methylcytosine-specific restriction endonuclease McrBC regulatory subunit McrC